MSNPWARRVTLVTGATGLLGSWLARTLADRGAHVVCVVRDWTPDSEFLRSGTARRVVVVRGDVTDQALVERALGEYEVEIVFHLAAQTIVGIANRNPISTFEANVAGTWRTLEACRRSPKVRAVVFASSDKAYGEQSELPYRESAPLQGRSPYDVSKSCADLIAQSYAASYGMPIVITRCGNLYGGGDLNWNRLVPGTIRSLLVGEAPTIRSDGTPRRDYVYVEDAVEAYLMVAERLLADAGLAGEAFNFSPGEPLGVHQMVTSIAHAMNRAVEPVVLGEATNEIQDQFLSSEKARAMLGWNSRFSLDEGLRRTIAWYREVLNGSEAVQRAA